LGRKHGSPGTDAEEDHIVKKEHLVPQADRRDFHGSQLPIITVSSMFTKALIRFCTMMGTAMMMRFYKNFVIKSFVKIILPSKYF